MSSAYSFLECKLINVGGTIGLENRHFAILSIIIDSGKDHQQMLRLLGERLLGNRIFTYSQVVTLLRNSYNGKMCLYNGRTLQSLPLAKGSNFMPPVVGSQLGCKTDMCPPWEARTSTQYHPWVLLPNMFHFTITVKKPPNRPRMWAILHHTRSGFLR